MIAVGGAVPKAKLKPGAAPPRRHHLRLALDLSALFLLLLWVAALAALATHDPADPPSPRLAPAHAEAHNLLGGFGAGLSSWLLARFGLATPAALGMALVLIMTMLLEGRRGLWLWRLLGWQALIPAVALLAELAGGPNTSWFDAGGQVGVDLHQRLGAHLTTAGEWIVGLALLVGGLGLTLDFAWPHALVLSKRLAYQWLRWYAGRRLRATERLLAAKQLERKQAADPRAAAIPIRTPETPKLKLLTPVPEEDDDKAKDDEGKDEEAPTPSKPNGAAAPAVLSLFSRATSLFSSPAASAASAPPAVPSSAVQAPEPAAEAPRPAAGAYKLPPLDLLEDPEPFPHEAHEATLRERAVKLEKVLFDFGLNVKVVGINTGPVITQFEIALETGVRLSKVTVLADDIALNLKVPSVRVVAPLPGKDTVGIEVPNEHRATVKLKETILAAGPKLQKMKIPLFLGKDTEGRPLIYDLAEMPHLLIAGRTGTGKSVCMNAIILSILMTRRPDEVKMVMIDPKMLEMSEYGKVPHLMHPVVKDMKKAEAILSWAVDKMEERYDILSRARVRSIAAYNELPPEEIYKRLKPADDEERARIPERMPYIVIFVDEMNDLMMMMRKEVEGHIIRLAQKSRAAGIHLVVATQKPTVDVITGLIKSNLPARICFQVSSRSDSRVVLDEMGAEKLLGRGDLLFLQPGTSTIVRAQGTYAGDRDIARVVDHLECEPAWARELIQLQNGTKSGKGGMEAIRARDELYEQAIEIVIREQRGSTSLLQRAMGIGYGRAARLIDFMAEDGIVGAYNGSNARDVLLKPEEWDTMKAKGQDEAA